MGEKLKINDTSMSYTPLHSTATTTSFYSDTMNHCTYNKEENIRAQSNNKNDKIESKNNKNNNINEKNKIDSNENFSVKLCEIVKSAVSDYNR